MKRQVLGIRMRTTTKEVTTERMQTIKIQWQNKFAELFATTDWRLLFNMDETSVL